MLRPVLRTVPVYVFSLCLNVCLACVERLLRTVSVYVLRLCLNCVEHVLESRLVFKNNDSGHIFRCCFQPINKVCFYMLSRVSRVSTVLKMF